MRKTLIALIVMACVSPALAQDYEAEPPPIVEASHNAVVAFLNLTEEQVEDWDMIYWQHREAEAPLKEEIAAIQEEIEDLFASGNPDPTDVGNLFIARRTKTDALVEVHVDYHNVFVLLLDDNQVRKLRFIARADDVQKIIPAFKLFELIPRR